MDKKFSIGKLIQQSIRAVKRFLRPVRASLTDGTHGARRMATQDWQSVHRAAGRLAPGVERHLLIAASGHRNMGDQAMLEAFLQRTRGPVTVLTEPGAVYSIPPSPRDVVVLAIPQLLRGRRTQHNSAVAEFARLLATHSTLSIVGADVIDGGYHRRSAATSWALAGAAAELGLDVRILGFSWRVQVERVIVDIAARAIAAGVVAYVRDPHSFKRFVEDGLDGKSVADTVFVLRLRTSGKLAQPAGRVLLNLSGLIHTRNDFTTEYVELIGGLVARGYRVSLAAHVASPNASDFEPIRAVLAALPPNLRSHVEAYEELPMPLETMERAAHFDLIVTGRMHLAILGLVSGTPAIILSTQGKVSGLVELLGLPGWSIEPRAGLAIEILKCVDNYRRDPDAVRTLIAQRLPDVRALAEENFAGIDGARPSRA